MSFHQRSWLTCSYPHLLSNPSKTTRSTTIKINNYVDITKGKFPPGTDEGDIAISRITYDDFFLIYMDLIGQTHEERYKTKRGVPTCVVIPKAEFAPFSHDADAPTPAPEPASLLLIGIGFIGTTAASRFISK